MLYRVLGLGKVLQTCIQDVDTELEAPSRAP